MNQLLAVVDDDPVFAQTLARRLTSKGLRALPYLSVQEMFDSQQSFTHILLDMNLGQESSLSHLAQIKQTWSSARILIITGYASIATTVIAIKQGADDYLTKPLDMPTLLQKLNLPSPQIAEQQPQVLSAAQLEWEHIQQVLSQHDGNISAAARALNMHRRTLQRKLQKKPSWQ